MTVDFDDACRRGIVAMGLCAVLGAAAPVPATAQDEDLPVIQSRRLGGAQQDDSGENAAGGGMHIGVAYAMSTSLSQSTRTAKLIAETGATAAKISPDLIAWGEMQTREKSPIDFQILDGFVQGYQSAGFGELVIPLKAHNKWACRSHDRKKGFLNPAPKPEYMDAYAAWISAIVERYDADGDRDMPGLQYPVRVYEIGAQFSAEEPEPPEEYVVMLRRAYEAAHSAYDEVLVAHAGFLTTTAFESDPAPGDYEAGFEAAGALLYHPLPSIRMVLDASDAFDLVNAHAMGNPYEIEDMITWLRYEMDLRGYEKPILIGASGTSPFILGGPATDCGLDAQEMGVIVPPATAHDRCRIADYFTRLLKGDGYTEEWTQRWAAADVIKKVVVAADQGVLLMNTAYIEDLDWLKKKHAKGSAGTAPWAGMLSNKDRRPSFLALAQLTSVLTGDPEITRIPAMHDNVRIYRIRSGDLTSWVAWADSEKLLLPGDKLPVMQIELPVSTSHVMQEFMTAHANQVHSMRKLLNAGRGMVTVDLTPYPAFIRTEF